MVLNVVLLLLLKVQFPPYTVVVIRSQNFCWHYCVINTRYSLLGDWLICHFVRIGKNMQDFRGL